YYDLGNDFYARFNYYGDVTYYVLYYYDSNADSLISLDALPCYWIFDGEKVIHGNGATTVPVLDCRYDFILIDDEPTVRFGIKETSHVGFGYAYQTGNYCQYSDTFYDLSYFTLYVSLIALGLTLTVCAVVFITGRKK
ncbi:MAG: hypothetical protein MJ072_06690, partial [Clostridia bacterium]|nr:hypothetical protein [Clostridia bacterium]